MSDKQAFPGGTFSVYTEAQLNEITEFVKNSTAKELFDLGRLELRENKNYEAAAERFSEALEKKVLELDIKGAIHSDLREYYLSFGDALLTKEEHKNDLFEFLKKQKILEVTDAENSTESEDVSDEQLAFEMLEFATKCYELYISELEKKKEEIPRMEVLNYSYAFLRLGDISLLNHFFPEALEEYKTCLNIREEHKVGDQNLIACLISVSQCYMFCGKRKVAVEHFERVKKILLDVRQKTTPLPEGTNEKIIKETYDDVQIQINDLQRQIEEEGEEGDELGSQTKAKELVITTKSEFDKAVLDKENNEVKKISVPRPEEEQPVAKKRRIDLSKYKN